MSSAPAKSYMIRLWALYFGALPFLYTHSGYEVFDLRLSLFLALIGFTFLSMMGRISASKNTSKGETPARKVNSRDAFSLFDQLLILGFGLRAISWIFTQFQGGWHSPGVGFHQLLIEGALLSFFIYLRRIKPGKDWYVLLCQILIVTTSLVLCAQAIGVEWVRELTQGRYNGNFFHPNVMGLCLAATLLCYYKEAPKAGPKILICLLGLACVFLSASKNALACLLILGALSARKKLPAILLALAILALALWKIGQSNDLEGFRNQPRHALKIRLAVFQTCLEAVKKNPFGKGPGSFAYKVHPYIAPSLHSYFPNPMRHSLNKAHNFVLEYLFETGWLILPLLAVLGTILFTQHVSGPSLACMLLLLSGLFSINLNYPTGQILLTLFAAGAINYGHDPDIVEDGRWS